LSPNSEKRGILDRSSAAAAFVATLHDVTRFRDAHQVEAYLGPIPCEWSSSETQRRGPITKAGNGRMRWLLVQAAWGILRRRKRPETAALLDWAERLRHDQSAGTADGPTGDLDRTRGPDWSVAQL